MTKSKKNVWNKKEKKLGNVPTRWRYDGAKLYMLFREGGCSYLIIEKALLTECVGESRIAILNDGRKMVLWNDKYSSALAS